MADTPIPHFFEGGYICADDWKEFRQFLNPSMESVNLVIEDRKDFLKEGGHESGGGFHTILVQRDLIGDDYQSRLLINTYTSRDSTIHTKDKTILSFSNSEIIFVIDRGTIFDTNTLTNLIVRFLDGEELTESFPFKLIRKDDARNSPDLRHCFIDD